MMLWLAFALCAVAILVAGSQLSRYGDEIARLTGLGGTWIGMVLLATVTSLPELMTGLSAVTVAGAPEVAVGDVLGSCVFNLAMIALLDVLQRPASVYSLAGRGHILGTAFGALMLALVGGALLIGPTFKLTLLHLSIVTPATLLLYLFAMHTIYHYERAQRVAQEQPAPTAPGALRCALVRYATAAAVVVGAAVALPFLAVRIAQALGWTQGFVGTSLVAMTTSLPELTVTLAAWRLKAVDLAIGNLIGSNLFNLAILAIDDIAYLPGPLLSQVSTAHAFSTFAAIGMSAAVIVALMAPPRARVLNVASWTSVLLVLLFFANGWIHLRHPA
ncbi:MAG: sodium:calcium antiporter [Burkholderiaceae bacterium]|jgi:cation:H+ antiporter|nr:sodium:calcium antiporter [Burkholderiaceae bacterium]